MRVLVLGAYGFIGSEVALGLREADYEVVAFGRSLKVGRRILPWADWRQGDLVDLTEPADWQPFLEDVDSVVNASGALQDGRFDSLGASQDKAIQALVAACETAGVRRFVQLSAPGADEDSSTAFMRTKAAADARLKRSTLEYTIVRPGLVVGRNAYGGTALIRMLAAMPYAAVTVFGDRLIQTVAMADVVTAVTRAIELKEGRRDLDLVAREALRLDHIVLRHRAWLGVATPRWIIDVPPALSRPVAIVADGLGWLGWRSPLRTTAMRVISEGVLGNADHASALLGGDALSLDDSLLRTPSGLQDRWHARLGLLMPVILASLSLLWLASGIIGLFRLGAVSAELELVGIHPIVARFVGTAGSLADIMVGAALLFRPTARLAALGMIALTLAYLSAGTVLRPDLWVDPYAPLVKAVPAMVLALVALALLDNR